MPEDSFGVPRTRATESCKTSWRCRGLNPGPLEGQAASAHNRRAISSAPKNSVKRTIPNLFHKIFFKGRESVGKVMCAKIILTKNNSQQNLTLPSTGKAKLSPKILRWASINMSFGEHFYETIPFYMARAGFKTKILCLSFLSAGITGVHYCDQLYEHNLPR